MGADIIVSYDGTPNDDDALALGRALAAMGASIALAYVRHTRELDAEREQLAQHDAEGRLRAGLELLRDRKASTHVVLGASTNQGLERLAATEGASVIVFGSDYRTPPGRAEPGNTAQRLLEGARVAIAVAAAGLRMRLDEPIRRIAVAAGSDDPSAEATAQRLAQRLGAAFGGADATGADLIVVGSSSGGQAGRVSVSGATRARLNAARGSVLVVARGLPVSLP
jgi:nucleotide-binding universal stress UspA family protein